MAPKKKRTSVEWVGGIVVLPAYVTGEGEPYRPEALFWMSTEGAVLGHVVGKEGEVLGQACESFAATIEHPMVGRPHRPDRVRVATPELALVLRAGHPGIEIVCAPTPELEAILAAMRAQMHEEAETEQSYLSSDVGPDALAAFFRAAAMLYRAQPWKTVPSDHYLLSVSIATLGVDAAALSIIGQMGQSFGLILFAGLDDFEAYSACSAAMERGEEPTIPPHLSLNYEPGAELGASMRAEVAEHRWELASPTAYPWMVAVDEDLVARPPTAREVTLAEALARVLLEVLTEKKALLAAWKGGAPVARTLRVATHAGEIEVTLRVPYPRAS